MTSAPATLFACDGCQRHVRASETVCPFCGVSLLGSTAAAAAARSIVAPRGLSRSAMLALAAAAAASGMALTACPTHNDVYGGPPIEDRPRPKASGSASESANVSTPNAGSDGGGHD